MAKPIFIITIPGEPNRDTYNRICKRYVDQLCDEYHVILLANTAISKTEFQMFSDKEIEPIKLDELKELIKSK